MASTFQHFMAWSRRNLGYWTDDRAMEHEGEAEQAAIEFEEAEQAQSAMRERPAKPGRPEAAS